MLQCTAVTETPIDQAVVALISLDAELLDDAYEYVTDLGFLLCQLGEHDETTEHTSHLWTAETDPPQGLWFTWTGRGPHRIFRFETLTLCPAILYDFKEDRRSWCGLHDHHAGEHTFNVEDPLRTLIHERARREAHRRMSEGDTD
ncbi:hypothetical protein ACFV6M_23980 [Streptomyces californicus]|uniref:hypothetical protein n=1 Tax=Streptomyces californicus TaxID=67351 RepID=UPI0033F34D41